MSFTATRHALVRTRRNAAALSFAFLLLGCRAREQGASERRPAAHASQPTPTPTALSAGGAARFGSESMRGFVTRELEGTPPLVIVLHGLGGSGNEIARAFGLEALAARKGFVAVAPDGALDAQGRRFWNAGKVCCNFDDLEVNDVERLSRLIDDMLTTFHADRQRVFVVGYSNGGFMAHRLACERADKLRAIVSIAAAGPSGSEPCQPTRPVAVLEIHGDADPIVPFEGGHLFGRAEMPISASPMAGILAWSRRAHCSTETPNHSVRALFPDGTRGVTDIFTFQGCESTSPVLWRVHGAGHVIGFGSEALDAVWDFLMHA